MHDEYARIAALEGPPAPHNPPPLLWDDPPAAAVAEAAEQILGSGRGGLWRTAGLGLAATAAAVGVLLQPVAGGSTTRGWVAHPDAPVFMQVAIDHRGDLRRYLAGTQVPIGDVAWFRVTASDAVTVWVDGPVGREVLARSAAAQGLLESPGGYVTYRFEIPGSYLFSTSTVGLATCTPGWCDRVLVEVR